MLILGCTVAQDGACALQQLQTSLDSLRNSTGFPAGIASFVLANGTVGSVATGCSNGFLNESSPKAAERQELERERVAYGCGSSLS